VVCQGNGCDAKFRGFRFRSGAQVVKLALSERGHGVEHRLNLDRGEVKLSVRRVRRAQR